jgi:glycerol dehydrogenase
MIICLVYTAFKKRNALMFENETSSFSPIDQFANANGSSPRIFGSPQRYIQGDGVIGQLGQYLSGGGIHRAAVLLSKRSQSAEGTLLINSLHGADIETVICSFAGECSLEEIGDHAEALLSCSDKVDVLIAVGGGKCVDTGKAIACRIGKPVIIVPTLASNDAPCSAVSVLYTPEGVTSEVEFYRVNPAMVLVDTGIVARASERYLVAGMGDAMATWYEARACAKCGGLTPVGGRTTLAGEALSKLCANILYEEGLGAIEAVALSRVDEALEHVVEANTLLSGIGFESGGLAAAHGVAQGYTVLPTVERSCLHGELVAMGLMTQLQLEQRPEEALRVATFFAEVGLPTHFDQIGMTADQADDLQEVAIATMDFPFLGNLGFEVTAQQVHQAMLAAHQLGAEVSAQVGDGAYQKIRT